MFMNNVVNGNIIFKKIVNNDSSFTITPPGSISKFLLKYEALTANTTGVSGIVRLASNSGVFVTTGYTSGSQQTAYNSNSLNNQNLTTGLLFTRSYTSGAAFSGFLYLMNLNTTNQVISYGQGEGSGGFFETYVGTLPTTSITMFRIQLTSSSFLSGRITVYSLL